MNQNYYSREQLTQENEIKKRKNMIYSKKQSIPEKLQMRKAEENMIYSEDKYIEK